MRVLPTRIVSSIG
jgi:hypothetical protein